jgi:hypothetical protein
MYDGQHAAVCPVVGAMAAPLIEKHKTLLPQQSFYLAEPNLVRRVSHLC